MIKIEQFLLLILVFIINNNVIRTQFVNYFNATKPYELQISIFENNTFREYDKSYNYFIDDHCSEIYYGEEKNNDSTPLNSKTNILVYKGTEKHFNFILEINFNTPKYLDFIEGYEIRVINKSVKSCLRIISVRYVEQKTQVVNLFWKIANYFKNLTVFKSEKNFKISIKDPQFAKNDLKYAFFFGRVSISSLTLCDHSNGIEEYCRISNSLINLDAGIIKDEKNLQHTTSFQNSEIKESYHFNERLPQLCVKYNKVLKPSLAYRYNLAIKLNDYYFISKSNLLNAKYKILLYYFDCKNKDKNDFCLGHALTRNIIQSHESINIDDLKDGLYGMELEPLLNTTKCKTQCPYQFDENSIDLVCENCNKVVAYFQIIHSKAVDKLNCMQISEFFIENQDNEIIKLDSTYFVDKLYRVKYPSLLFYTLKREKNWFQIGVWGAVAFILFTIIVVIILATKNSYDNKNIKTKAKKYEVELGENEALNDDDE